MANNVKPDDLAIVVYDAIPENIGAVVLVGERGLGLAEPDRVWWSCTTEGRPLLARCVDPHTGILTNLYARVTEFEIEDRCLRPVSGLPLEDEVSAPKEISLA